MRLKLICILGAVLFVFMYMCSCVGKAEAMPQASSYSITRVHYDPILDMRIYRVNTPFGVKYVMWEADKGGMCTLN